MGIEQNIWYFVQIAIAGADSEDQINNDDDDDNDIDMMLDVTDRHWW